MLSNSNSCNIRRCPCCGGLAALLQDKETLSYYVECSVCGLRTRKFYNDVVPKEEAAISAWNLRKSDPDVDSKFFEEYAKAAAGLNMEHERATGKKTYVQ